MRSIRRPPLGALPAPLAAFSDFDPRAEPLVVSVTSLLLVQCPNCPSGTASLSWCAAGKKSPAMHDV